MATDVEFSKRLKEHSEVVRFAQEILGIMASSDIQHDARKGAETVDKIRSKVSKSKEGTHTSIHELEMRKTCLKAKIDQECSDAIMDDMTNGLSEDSVSIMKSSVIKISEQISGKAKDCKKLENERKILEFHKKHRKLQRKVFNVQFDLTSTENCIKGYYKGSDGTLQTFVFNPIEDSLFYVSNYLWDSV